MTEIPSLQNSYSGTIKFNNLTENGGSVSVTFSKVPEKEIDVGRDVTPFSFYGESYFNKSSTLEEWL